MTAWIVEGYAIVSADDRIATADGAMPEALRNEADWQRFQAALDASDLTVLGRLGHEAHGNARRRLRMVVSTASPALERRSDGWWWNPAALPWPDAVAAVLPHGGRIAVPGGQGVFDLFLNIGYDAFHLTRAAPVRLPAGRGLFAAVETGQGAANLLSAGGLIPTAPVSVDDAAGVTLVTWVKNRNAS